MTELLCQSVSTREAACSLRWSSHLCGVHLCGQHQRYWKPRVQKGAKISVHPARGLPLAYRCAGEWSDGLPERACDRCDVTKPASEFYRESHGRTPMRSCKACWNKAIGGGRQKPAAVPKPAEPMPARPAEPVWMPEWTPTRPAAADQSVVDFQTAAAADLEWRRNPPERLRRPVVRRP